MSEKEQQFERIYKETENFGRTQFVREIQAQINDNKKKDKEIERLNNIINKAIEYVEESYNETVEGIDGVAKFFSKRNEILLKILKGSDK